MLLLYAPPVMALGELGNTGSIGGTDIGLGELGNTGSAGLTWDWQS